MEKATRHRNGARTTTQPTVLGLVARAAGRKSTWASLPVGSPAAAAAFKEARLLDGQITRTRSTTMEEVGLKLALLTEWLGDTMTPTAQALLRSVTADVADLYGQPLPAAQLN